MRPDLGVLLFADYSLDELGRLGRLCEELGYRCLWYTDVRFGRECYLGLASIAAHTESIELGPGVTDPYTRHPAITAAAIATFDEMCGGRARLGLGVGGQGFRELGIDRPRPITALRETVAMVRALLRGERVDREGKIASLANGKLTFTPPRGRIPIYFATHGAQVSALAGEIADGALIANTVHPGMLSFYLDRVGKGLAKSGRSMADFDFGLRVEACISADREAALAVMRRRMAARLIGQYPHWDYLRTLGIEMPDAFRTIAESGDETKAGEAAVFVPDALLRSTVLAGDVALVARQLADVLRPEVGSVTIRPHRVEGESVEEVIRLFAQEVMPQVERLTGAASVR